MGGVISSGDRILEKGIEAALDEGFKIALTSGHIAEGVERQFSAGQLKELETFAQIASLWGTATKGTLFPKTIAKVFKQFLLHTQQYVTTPNRYDTSHPYKTFTMLTRENYYARTLPEIKTQYFVDISDEEKAKMVETYLKRWPTLAIKEDDDDYMKQEKQKLLDHVPHAMKVGDALFTRKTYVQDDDTAFLLPCFGQWFIEQAFKTGTDIYARQQIDEMSKSEFMRQWGHNRVDLSNVYGDNDLIAWALRSKRDGKMKMQQKKVGEYFCDFPPKLTFKTENISADEVSWSDCRMFIPKNISQEEAQATFYALGHPRFNLHFGMVFIQTLWLREHNRVCDILKNNNPEWSDERLFQTAKMILIAECSKIVIEDYIQHISGYQTRISFHPEVVHDTEFQYSNRCHVEFNMLYRWHSLVPDVITLGGVTHKYADLQFKPKLVEELGMKVLLDDLIGQKMGRLGLKNTPDFLKNLDITTILHSRALKLQSYNEYRVYFGSPKVTKFSEITKDVQLQKELEELYGNVNNIDWYVGIMAEDHYGKGMTGEVMQQMIETYAFAALFSNPLVSKDHWKAETFTHEGFDIVKKARFHHLINDNLQENGCRPYINKSNIESFDPFKATKLEKDIKKTKVQPYKTGKDSIAKRRRAIDKECHLWPIYYKSHPIRLDDSHITLRSLVDLSMDSHNQILLKRQLLAIFKALSTSVHTKTFVQTLQTQFEIITSILSSESSFLSTKEIQSLVGAVDSSHFPGPREDLLDHTYGNISKYFGNYSATHLTKFNWNRDEVFGEVILNGLDPTQLCQLKEKQLMAEFEKFVTPAGNYFEKRFKKKFVEEVRNGKLYFIDNFETMNLITSDPANTARPRGLFYWDDNTQKLLPIGIQLNPRVIYNFKISKMYGQNLPKMDLLSLSDPFLQIEVGGKKVQTSVKWNNQNPKWTETFEFSADGSESVGLRLMEKDMLTNQMVDDHVFKVWDLKEGKNEIVYKLSNGGSIHVRIDAATSGKDDDSVLIPTDPNWTIGKLFLGNSYVVHHEFVTHNLKCHSVMEAVSICMHHTLYKNHPVRRLLEPHLYYTETVNTMARKTLMKDDGTGLVSVLFACGVDGYKINDHFFKKFDLFSHSFPENLARNNIQIPEYSWGTDGQKVWNAIKVYVESVLKYYFAQDEDFLKDQELQDFLNMLETHKLLTKLPMGSLPGVRKGSNSNGSKSPKSSSPRPHSPAESEIKPKIKVDKKKRKSFGFLESMPESDMFNSLREAIRDEVGEAPPQKGMSLYTLDDIVYFVTTMIFNATGQHTALHYSQLDMMSFAPLLPTILNSPPPAFGDKSFGTVKDGYILSAEQQMILMKYLPTMGQSIMINATFDPVTKANDLVPLISTHYSSFSSEPCLGFFYDFQRSLQKISNEIQKRKTYLYLSKMNQSINF